MMCLAGYLLVGLMLLVFFTYLDAKFSNTFSNNNHDIVFASFIWPLSIPILIIFLVLYMCDKLVDRLRNYFNKDSK